MEFLEMNPKKTQDGVTSQPWCDDQLHDDGAAKEGCKKTDVRRSLKGLRNEAHEDEANVPPSLFIQIKHWS